MNAEQRRAKVVRDINSGRWPMPKGAPPGWLGEVIKLRHKSSNRVYEVAGEVDRGSGFHPDGRYCIVAGFWRDRTDGIIAWCCWYRFERRSWDWMFIGPMSDFELWPPLTPGSGHVAPR